MWLISRKIILSEANTPSQQPWHKDLVGWPPTEDDWTKVPLSRDCHEQWRAAKANRRQSSFPTECLLEFQRGAQAANHGRCHPQVLDTRASAATASCLLAKGKPASRSTGPVGGMGWVSRRTRERARKPAEGSLMFIMASPLPSSSSQSSKEEGGGGGVGVGVVLTGSPYRTIGAEPPPRCISVQDHPGGDQPGDTCFAD